MQPDSQTIQPASQSLTDLIVKLHADQELLEQQHATTQEKLTNMIKQLDNQGLTLEQLTFLQDEFRKTLEAFDQAINGIKERLQKIVT